MVYRQENWTVLKIEVADDQEMLHMTLVQKCFVMRAGLPRKGTPELVIITIDNVQNSLRGINTRYNHLLLGSLK